MNIQRIREKINLAIYDLKTPALQIMRVLSVFVSLIAVISLLYFHGFNTTGKERAIITLIIKAAFGFFIFKYFTRLFFSFQPIKDFKDTIFEGILMLIIVANVILSLLFNWELIRGIGNLFGLDNIERFFALVIQGYIVLILINEIGRAGSRISSLNLSPPTLLISSFLLLIAGGTGLLMLPEMTVSGQSMPFMHAMFTSISASCVTGLVVVDTATYFSFKGQFVIMMLIQLGGLNIISFASVFALFARKGIGLKHQSILQENLNAESLSASSSLFKQIFIFSLVIEMVGAILIFFSWKEGIGLSDFTDRAFYSIFHSISAFNNAGFSTFSNGLYEHGVRNSYFLHIVIAILIFLGGIGFTTLRDVFSFSRIKERFQKKRFSLRLDTKLSLYSAAILILAGFIIFMIFENHNVLQGQSTGGQIVTSFFQSVTTRTAGFNTVDFGALTKPVLIFMILLMFIGASPGSTGGGIKTNTFALVLLGAWSTTRGKPRLELFRSTISFELLNKAFLIFLFSLGFISIGIFGLAITEPNKDLLSLSFEEVSAFGTVGLSTGITSALSPAGRVIIMLSMFIGRIGTLSLAFALGRKKKIHDYKYPKANILVG